MQLENTSVNIGVPSNDICAALLPPVCLQKLPSVSFRPKTAKLRCAYGLTGATTAGFLRG